MLLKSNDHAEWGKASDYVLGSAECRVKIDAIPDDMHIGLSLCSHVRPGPMTAVSVTDINRSDNSFGVRSERGNCDWMMEKKP